MSLSTEAEVASHLLICLKIIVIIHDIWTAETFIGNLARCNSGLLAELEVVKPQPGRAY